MQPIEAAVLEQSSNIDRGSRFHPSSFLNYPRFRDLNRVASTEGQILDHKPSFIQMNSG